MEHGNLIYPASVEPVKCERESANGLSLYVFFREVSHLCQQSLCHAVDHVGLKVTQGFLLVDSNIITSCVVSPCSLTTKSYPRRRPLA